MSTFRLDKLFAPRSVALVGASPRDTSPGRAVLSNLRAAAFEGSIDLVNPHYAEIEGIKAVKNIQDLQTPPDLLVIVTPAQSVPGIVPLPAKRVLRPQSSSPPVSGMEPARSPMAAKKRPG